MDLGKLSELADHRTCIECGAEFRGTKESSALEQFSDHLTLHQPTQEQWTKAYNMMREDRERSKGGMDQSTPQTASASSAEPDELLLSIRAAKARK